MSPDPDNAWRYDEKGKQVRVETEEDEKGTFFNVKQNSLVYIRLLQKLRMPYYMIGRHNLKISYVYQGLLLGTGPQVDPGFLGNLYIPLHNLTNKDVKIYKEESFVSIDFVRTSPHIFSKGKPCTEKKFYELYQKEKALFDPKKRKREKLENYLGGKTPFSSLGHLVPEMDKTKTEIENFKEKISGRIDKFYIGGVIIIILTLITLLAGLFYHFDNKFESINNQILRGAVSNTQINAKSDEYEKTINKLNNKIEVLEKHISSLKDTNKSIDKSNAGGARDPISE